MKVGPYKLIHIDDYERFVGSETVDRIRRKAERLRGVHVVNINSTYYGGGVAQLLSSLTLLMNSLGIQTGWRVIQGTPEFFSITKRIHNALQGDRSIPLTDRDRILYEQVVFENAVRNHLDQEFIVVHDPQPLPMVVHYRKKGPWIWRCHVDLTSPDPGVWGYLRPFIEQYNAVVLSLEGYRQTLDAPQVFEAPTTDPWAGQNVEIDEAEINRRLERHKIPLDLPILSQISRFDRWKDPEGVIRVFQLVRKQVPCTLVLLGNVATDDPTGPAVYHALLAEQEERIHILSIQDAGLVNALQRRSAVVLQKSLREGFGLTVTEAMWKGTPVVGGNVGGIRCQIRDGYNGFLVSSVEEAADRVVRLLQDEDLRNRMGRKAHETVRRRFLITRNLEEQIDLLSSFETIYRLKR